MIDTKDLELAIVGGLMIDDSYLEIALIGLNDEHFTNDTLRDIFNAMRSISYRERPVDSTMVISELRKDKEYDYITPGIIYEICCNAPTPKNIQYYVEELQQTRNYEYSTRNMAKDKKCTIALISG
jgi:replicative DNA helicase